jgi:splicing factor U2AF subunit
LQRDERRDRNRDRDRGEREHDRDRDHRRHRSRSPRPRGGGSSRRDYEVDTYSSSRDFREREREDRYARDHRRPDDARGAGPPSGPGGGWDRDRGSRRDRRGDDDRRRGGGGGDHEERRRGGGPPRGPGPERRRSASPPAKRKEPTPDLTEVVSVLERKRRLTQWDLKPPGYENVTAEQAKLSGMFPLPGAPRQQAMDTTRLQAFLNQPGAQASSTALKPSQARQSKRLFVYNVPAAATEAGLVEFFNLQLNGLNVISSPDPCLSTLLSKEKGYAMVEFRTSEDATVALALDGIEMEGSAENGVSNGKPKGLQIKRPQDYIAPTASEEDTKMDDGYVSNVVNDSPNKISVTQIPVHWSDEQVTELLVTFGKLKAFVVVKDTGSEQSRVRATSSRQPI